MGGILHSMRNTIMRTTLASMLVVGAVALSACSSTKEAAETTTSVVCSKEAGDEAMKTPVGGVRKVTVTDDGAVVETSRDAKGNSWSVLSGSGAEVISTKGATFALFKKKPLEGTTEGEWVRLPQVADGAVWTEYERYGDEVLLGSETIDEGVHQIGYWVNPESVLVESFISEASGCEYKMTADAPEGEDYAIEDLVVHTDKQGRITNVAVTTEYGEAYKVTVAYDVADISAPEKVSTLSEAEVAEKIAKQVEYDRIVMKGQSFDRQLRSMAAMGDTVNNNPEALNPQKAALLIDMAQAGDIPREVTVTVKGADGKPVTAWQGGALKVGIDALQPLMTHVQVSENGMDACVYVSATATEASRVESGPCEW